VFLKIMITLVLSRPFGESKIEVDLIVESLAIYSNFRCHVVVFL